MIRPPAGLVDGQRRLREVQLVAEADWFLIERGGFYYVGSGDVSEADLVAVGHELPAAVFVCVWRPKPIETLPPKRRSLAGPRRTTRMASAAADLPPKLRWVSKHGRIALVPGGGIFWVDPERLFQPGDVVPLPWTRPAVELRVMRSPQLLELMREAVGPDGPVRASRLERRSPPDPY